MSVTASSITTLDKTWAGIASKRVNQNGLVYLGLEGKDGGVQWRAMTEKRFSAFEATRPDPKRFMGMTFPGTPKGILVTANTVEKPVDEVIDPTVAKIIEMAEKD